MDASEELVPIRTVCAMYGLNPNTLRTWERRYGLISPRRTEGGHRGFGQADLQRIQSMLAYIEMGLSPADAAARTRSMQPVIVPEDSRAVSLARQLRQAVDGFDSANAVDICRNAISSLGYDAAVESVLFPELNYRGDHWAETKSGVAAEHLASLSAKTAIYEHLRVNLRRASGPVVTLACVPGEEHDMSIVHTANLLCDAGGPVPLVLAAGLPISEIMKASTGASSHAVLLSATMVPRPTLVREWVQELCDGGWEERTILVGPGFSHSRIFSETRVKAVTGGYEHAVTVLRQITGLTEPVTL